jgi:hypothetical protein
VRLFVTLVLAAALVGLTGCGGGPQFAPVSGRVTMNDQPLAEVQVDFQPMTAGSNKEPGPGSTAVTDADGRFVLHNQLNKSQAGAVVGKHQVRIWPSEAGGGGADADPANPKKKKKAAIPGRYHTETTLTFDVPAAGTEKADFKLTSP